MITFPVGAKQSSVSAGISTYEQYGYIQFTAAQTRKNVFSSNGTINAVRISVELANELEPGLSHHGYYMLGEVTDYILTRYSSQPDTSPAEVVRDYTRNNVKIVTDGVYNYNVLFLFVGSSTTITNLNTTGIFDNQIPLNTISDVVRELGLTPNGYPITYSYTNSTVSGPSVAEVGDTVTVSAVPDNNYGITDPASQILVTNNDVAVPYQWNPSTNTITFVMPDPS